MHIIFQAILSLSQQNRPATYKSTKHIMMHMLRMSEASERRCVFQQHLACTEGSGSWHTNLKLIQNKCQELKRALSVLFGNRMQLEWHHTIVLRICYQKFSLLYFETSDRFGNVQTSATAVKREANCCKSIFSHCIIISTTLILL